MQFLWALIICVMIALAIYAANRDSARFLVGLVVGFVITVGLDMAFWQWGEIQSSDGKSFIWTVLFWPDCMVWTIATQDWGWAPGGTFTKFVGYSSAGLCYGVIAGTTHALRKRKTKPQ